MKKHRMFYILLSIMAALLLLNVRLFWIQLAASRNWTDHKVDLVENSVIQREQGIVLDSGRGHFYDRHGKPLTGQKLPVLTAFPVRKQSPEAERETSTRIARILHTTAADWQRFTASLNAPQVWSVDGRAAPLSEQQIAEITALGLPQVKVTHLTQRYDDPQLASHVIGYIGQNPDRITRQFTDQIHNGELQLTSKIGGSGLEKTFEPWLQGIGSTSVALFTDGLKRPIPGLDTRVIAPGNGYYPLKVITTLDSAVQRRMERAMDKLKVAEGSVVVLDAANADVIAMANRPLFNPEHVDLHSGSWSNRALKAVAPGSVFKTVSAAAALEEKVAQPDDKFVCNGDLGKYGLTCWKKDGHGRISFRDGYAQSCNIVFAEIAGRLKGASLETYANKLGLGVSVGWKGDFMQESDFHQWDAEEPGQVYAEATAREDGGVKAQSAIGQRDVLATPLQAANMVVTLLHQGEVLAPRVVSEVRFRNGRLMERLDEHKVEASPGRVSNSTATRLLTWMSDVVDHGTGQPLQTAKWSLAGKSGTAQVSDKGGNPLVNQWFVGYGPTEHPKYAVAVLVANVPVTGVGKSLPLFREAMDILAELELSSH